VVDEVGDVDGKDLLHLQCHFGLDTLAWAQRGAHVTGVDFSERAIALARSLAAETGLEARFIHSDVLELDQALDGDFEVVFTSFGVLWWLPDLTRWATIAARFVRPGGMLYLAEFHPFSQVMDDGDVTGPTLFHPYFPSPEPLVFPTQGSYADPDAKVRTWRLPEPYDGKLPLMFSLKATKPAS
jgi:SAM-dependent methyltransferase